MPPMIDQTKCKICGLCAQICPLDVFAKENDAEVVQFDSMVFGVSTKDKRNSFIKKYRKYFKFDLQKKIFFSYKIQYNPDNTFPYSFGGECSIKSIKQKNKK